MLVIIRIGVEDDYYYPYVVAVASKGKKAVVCGLGKNWALKARFLLLSACPLSTSRAG